MSAGASDLREGVLALSNDAAFPTYKQEGSGYNEDAKKSAKIGIPIEY